MALRKPFEPLALFSMSSMTDVIFLLLIFFMVTSSLIFPSAIDVKQPQSSNQTSNKPVTEVYIDSLYNISIVVDRTDSINPEKAQPLGVDLAGLAAQLKDVHDTDSLRTIALSADKRIEYVKVVDILDVAARQNLKMVLATRVGTSGNNTTDTEIENVSKTE